MNSNNIIYTLQTDILDKSSVVQIETVINRGLYRFTLIGMNTRKSSDTKDRVYSALRSSDLLNLKSDNRKIIVTLSPYNATKKEDFYDLGIALSCICCIDKKVPEQTMFVFGELSISGKIVPTKMMYQAIYSAYINNISIVICSTEDVYSIEESIIQDLKSHNINILHSKHLSTLIPLIKSHDCKDILPVVTKKPVFKETFPVLFMKDMDSIVSALYISICGGHRIIIETQSVDVFKKRYEEFYTYVPQKRFGEFAYKAYTQKLNDDRVDNTLLYIENIQHAQDVKKMQSFIDSIVSTHTPCPCGYTYSFFELKTQKNTCLCSKKSILQYKRNIENKYYSLFNMKENHTLDTDNCMQNNISSELLHKNIDFIRNIQFFRHIHRYNLKEKDVFFLGNMSYLNNNTQLQDVCDLLDKEAYDVWIKSDQHKDVVMIAQTIQDILNTQKHTKLNTINSLEDYIQYIKEKPIISRQALLLALSYVPKMDF